MNYFVIDLEMCRVPSNYRGGNYKYAREIIQIGSVLLDETYRQTATLRQYICPDYGVMDYYISKLTGIRNRQIKKAPKLEEALLHMLDLLEDREYRVITWSESDHIQFQREIRSKGIENDRIDCFMEEDRWVDYQKVFGERYNFSHPVSLENALLLCDIEPEGRPHDGLTDAINTAKIIEKLESNPNYKMSCAEKELDKKPLRFTLGELLAGLNIQLAG